MLKINILIASGDFLIRQGLTSLISLNKDFKITGQAVNGGDLFGQVKFKKPDILVIDHTSQTFSIQHVEELKKRHPGIHILSITPIQDKNQFNKALEAGVTSYLLHECDSDEITEALYATAKGEKFMCGKVISILVAAPSESIAKSASETSCEGMHITQREMEIIRMVAEGYSNKQIADKLFLSNHTVTTHRKNIMNKLGVNNTAGLVLFAVRKNLVSPNKFLFSASN